MAIIRSTAPRARAAISGIDDDLVPHLPQRGRAASSGVIIFMYLQDARSLTAWKSTPGAALRSWWIMPISVATSTCRDVLTLAASTISPVDRILTRSAGTAPAVARYSALVAQPHSGWMYRSASGIGLGLRGQLAAVDPGVHVALAAPDRDVVPAEHPPHVRAEELVRAEQHRGVGGDRADHLDRVGGGAADVGLGLHLGGGVDVGDHDGAGVLAPSRPATGRRSANRPASSRPRASGISTVLSGREDLGGLGHEVHAAEDDRRLRRGGRDPGQGQRIADVVGDVLDLAAPGSCAPG